jgi:hypothetical protein
MIPRRKLSPIELSRDDIRRRCKKCRMLRIYGKGRIGRLLARVALMKPSQLTPYLRHYMLICPKCGWSSPKRKQARALVTCLRRVTKDPEATPAQKLKACEFLAVIEGIFPGWTRPPGRPVTKTEEPSPVEEAIVLPGRGAPSRDPNMEPEDDPDLMDLYTKIDDETTET